MGAFKLGKMTFGSLFKKPETIQYPLEKKPQPDGLKGHIEIDADACILCGMCDRSCATNCITVDKAASTWAIDRLQCVQCGYCITVCPKKCLSMNPDYAPATTVHEPDIVAIPQVEKPKAAKTPTAAKAAAPDKAQAEPATPAPKADSGGVVAKDEQVAAILRLMDDQKAEKVRAALQ